jgi:hypothetical protein
MLLLMLLVVEVGYGADACDAVVVLAVALVDAVALDAPVVLAILLYIPILGYCDVLGLYPRWKS